jgi:hypothetical protein
MKTVIILTLLIVFVVYLIFEYFDPYLEIIRIDHDDCTEYKHIMWYSCKDDGREWIKLYSIKIKKHDKR